jgi:DNA-binding sugar fermentation-stimulating protein
MELLLPGASVLQEPASKPGRCTSRTIIPLRHRRRWVSVVPALANRILEGAMSRAARAGVRILACDCRVIPRGIRLDRRIPAVL